MNQKTRWEQRLEDLTKTYSRLAEAISQDDFEELEKDGVIQRFEFTFELAWKTLKDYLEDQGFTDISSPKKVLRKAFQGGLFQDDEIWLKMLEDRNSLSHLYKQEMSEIVFQKIKNDYTQALGDLILKLEKEQ